MAAKLQIVRNYIGSCMTRYLRRRLRPGSPFAIISRYGVALNFVCQWPVARVCLFGICETAEKGGRRFPPAP